MLYVKWFYIGNMFLWKSKYYVTVSIGIQNEMDDAQFWPLSLVLVTNVCLLVRKEICSFFTFLKSFFYFSQKYK